MKHSNQFINMVAVKAVSIVSLAALVAGCGASAATTATTLSASPGATSPSSGAASPTTLNPVTGFPTGIPGDLPNGAYKVEITDADLAAVNVPKDSWGQGHGTFTWTLTNGVWSSVQEADNPIRFPTANGVYIVDGNHVTFLVKLYLGPQEFTWNKGADGSLTLTALPSTSSDFAAMLASHPLVPIQ